MSIAASIKLSGSATELPAKQISAWSLAESLIALISASLVGWEWYSLNTTSKPAAINSSIPIFWNIPYSFQALGGA